MVVLMGGCDADKQPPPTPKVAAEAPAPQAKDAAVQAKAADDNVSSAVAAPVVAIPKPEPAEPAEHALAPNVPTVPVVASSKPQPVPAKPSAPGVSAKSPLSNAPSGNARSAKVKEDNAEVARRAPVASKSKTPAQVVKDTQLPKANLDLSLPPDMVKQLTPPSKVITAAHPKPLLPKMFPDAQSDPDFELNGRLLSNEMQLQLRNDSRRDVEGAAVDFTFRK
ncbi:hypothetical protein ABQX22_24120 [Xanthomonas sp. WHRI 1810A]|uniref:hypothetical protein n=1 Tax=Xanthomonas sp. WHRI 1810A TaxID=3161565 RepID=UPI0032E90D2A